MKNKKILVIGGTGFIGYHLLKKCLKNKWISHSLSTKKPKKKRFLKNVKYLYCDISKKEKLQKTLHANYDYVVNLGGYVDHANKKKTYKSHFLGCKNLCEIFLKKKITSFVQIGSSAEYGRNKSPQNETTKCKPSSIYGTYGKSKLLSTLYLMELFKKKKFPCTVLRLYQVYGPQQDFNRFIPIIIKACLLNSSFPCSAGNQKRDFTYVKDVVDAIIKSLMIKKSRGQIINIGTGKVKKLKNVIEYIKRYIKGGKPKYGVIKLRKDEIINVSPSLYSSKKILDWKAKIDFKTGLNNTIKHIRKDLEWEN